MQNRCIFLFAYMVPCIKDTNHCANCRFFKMYIVKRKQNTKLVIERFLLLEAHAAVYCQARNANSTISRYKNQDLQAVANAI